MAILVECPQCKRRRSLRTNKCACGTQLKKLAHKTYWIEYYLDGRRRRERIGPSKGAAEQRLRDVLKARTENRYIDKDKAVRVTLGELCKWYSELPEVRAKESYRRDLLSIKTLKRLIGDDIKISHLTPGLVEGYQRKRLDEASRTHIGKNVRPATVNRELSCLKSILNRAVRYSKIDINPIANARKLPENNVRQRILTNEEFERLLDACDEHLRPIVLTAYYTGMRKSEIVYLTWSEIDLEKGFIRLKAARTKTKTPRPVPLHPLIKNMLTGLPRAIHTDRVFLRNGNPFNEIKHSYQTACKRAGIEDFTFHDLRHCAINNLRLAGNDYFKIMAISGHKTISVFKRYNLVTENELSNIKWTNQGQETGKIATYMDTKAKRITSDNP